MRTNLFRVAKKELNSFFSSPVAFIFFGTFLIVTLFIFFWVETFFARNIADVRPLFEWMPLLLIFLVASITMRMWSEERRMGTLEFLFTQPVSILQLVLGKFIACMSLVGVALLLTLPVPVTISFLGKLDWGPVFGAYLATMFLAAAYTAIGLTISAKSDNQIVSLIATVLTGAFFYLLGSDMLTPLVGNYGSEFLKLLGTGSRFDSITRGVIDIRDLYYYLSIVGVFISLNVYFLETLRWSKGTKNKTHIHWRLITVLLAANFIAGNLWLHQVSRARADITEGHIYSISEATRGYLRQLQEPLLIRGYFSAKTHPLLAPLVPRLKDLILEYEVAGQGKVRAEFIDPLENPDLEKEAGEKYGIKPVPFQVADKYQAALVNSYFNILVQYGDQYEVLGFQDLIEVKSQSETDLNVELRNPEYDITRSIKKVLYTFRGTGDIFASINSPIVFTGYISPDSNLPEALAKLKSELSSLLEEIKASSGGKFSFSLRDPNAEGGALVNEIAHKYGFRPMRTGLFDARTFYFYMILSGKEQTVQVPIPEDLNKEGLRRGIEAALKRFPSGFLKTVALYTPPPPVSANPYMRQFSAGKQFQLLHDSIQENRTVRTVDLKDGVVPGEADILMVAAPDRLDAKQLFAIDQFLMKGGTVVIASAPFEASLRRGGLAVSRHDSGLKAWLEHKGITLEDTMVLDPQNSSLPIPVRRNLGGFVVREIRMVNYPYFVDVRGEGMPQDKTLAAGIPQVTLNWASPISIDEKKNDKRKVTPLLKSSAGAWTSDSTQIAPDFRTYGELGFKPGDERQSYLLAALIEGQFESFYKDKDSPLLEKEDNDKSKDDKDKDRPDKEEKEPVFSGVIDKSPESARIILFASNEFLTDETLRLSSAPRGTRYLNSIQLVENVIDWSLEDRGLLSIRSRGHFSRTLNALDKDKQMFWEYLNYGLALLGLLMVYAVYYFFRRRARRHYEHNMFTNFCA